MQEPCPLIAPGCRSMPAMVPSVIESPMEGTTMVTSCQTGAAVCRSLYCRLNGSADAASPLILHKMGQVNRAECAPTYTA